MRSPDDPHCPFQVELSHEELASLEWLFGVCAKISQNPKSCNRVKAALAARALEKMRDQLNDSHVMLHDLEDKAAEQAAELSTIDSAMVRFSKRSSRDGFN
jgi:hypothetical protein